MNKVRFFIIGKKKKEKKKKTKQIKLVLSNFKGSDILITSVQPNCGNRLLSLWDFLS